jgi:hypothetical protein
VADSDEGAAVAQVAFQEHVHDVSATGGAVREMPSWSGTLVGYIVSPIFAYTLCPAGAEFNDRVVNLEVIAHLHRCTIWTQSHGSTPLAPERPSVPASRAQPLTSTPGITVVIFS